jgi:hypothetical protein
VRAADFGTLCHYWKETGDTEMPGADPRDIVCLEKKLLLSGIRREDWWSGGEHEVTFAIHLETLEAMRYDEYVFACESTKTPADKVKTRDQWKEGFAGPEWLTGTIDYLYPDGRGDDLKTGRWPVDPATSKQLRSYALLPWLEAGRPIKGWNKEWTITTWQKYRLDGLPTREGHVLTGFELADHLEDLRWAATHPEEVNPGEDACRFCDCKPVCPAWVDEDKTPEDVYE